MKSPTDTRLYPGPIDMTAIAANDDVLIDENSTRSSRWDEDIDVKNVLPYDSGSNVVDRYEFGRELLEQTEALGVDKRFETVVNGVVQAGQVEDVEAVGDGEPVTYHADLVIDAGGSLSTVMAAVDFGDLAAAPETSFAEPHCQQFGSAYRAILRTPEPVPYDNAPVYGEHGLGTRIASKDPYNVAASNAGMENVEVVVALLPEAGGAWHAQGVRPDPDLLGSVVFLADAVLDPQRLAVDELADPLFAEFTAVARILDTAEGNPRVGLDEFVDEGTAHV